LVGTLKVKAKLREKAYIKILLGYRNEGMERRRKYFHCEMEMISRIICIF